MEISVVLILSLQKYKFFQDNFNPDKLDIKYFADNLFENFDFQETLALCLYPVSLIKNVVNTLVFLRKNNPEILANEYNTSRLISYFALIYSCNPNIIKNPHLRSEIFDILLNILIVYSEEKNRSKIFKFLNNFILVGNLTKLLIDEFVQKHLIHSIIKVFIDAERLGTSNQFYEKFSIRHKILYLIEKINKTNRLLFTEKIMEYSESNKDDMVKMINLLMNDLTFLYDECIERLEAIKCYQDLLEDVLFFINYFNF